MAGEALLIDFRFQPVLFDGFGGGPRRGQTGGEFVLQQQIYGSGSADEAMVGRFNQLSRYSADH